MAAATSDGIDAEAVRSRLARIMAEAHDRQAAALAHVDGVIAAVRGDNVDDEHDPEGPTLAFERAQTEAIARQAEEAAAEAAAAIARLDAGTYGVCESCGQRIAPARLAARPTARLCVVCASGGGRA